MHLRNALRANQSGNRFARSQSGSTEQTAKDAGAPRRRQKLTEDTTPPASAHDRSAPARQTSLPHVPQGSRAVSAVVLRSDLYVIGGACGVHARP
eukprot:scaffold4991_cov196-Pinguiococcus_pyrenoidosus.AAC.1